MFASMENNWDAVFGVFGVFFNADGSYEKNFWYFLFFAPQIRVFRKGVLEKCKKIDVFVQIF